MIVVYNFRKVQKTWMRMSFILILEEADAKISGFSFKLVLKSFLLFILEMWVMVPPLLQDPGRLYN